MGYSCSCTTPLSPHNHLRRFSISAAVRRHHRLRLRRHLTPLPSSSDQPTQPNHQTLKIVIINTHSLTRNLTGAIEDLKTLISVDDQRNLTLSLPSPPTLLLLRNLSLSLFLFIFLSRAFLRLIRFVSFNNGGKDEGVMVYRRDRSLGGKQVLVGKKVDSSPMLLPRHRVGASQERREGIRREERRLPSWWPVLGLESVVTTDEEKAESQKLADRLIRAILDQRLIGNDISEHDIFQFRRLCRESGVRVFIETTNARDSFYRASVDFVLRVCESVDYHSSSVNIDGEDAQQFVAGIAANIGVENFHAARIVTASIAARTRSCFLQAWALEMQGKHSEALAELSKICLLHRIFPPDDNSPEMEMVAKGLEKNLNLEQRRFLMGMFDEICRDGNRRSVAEALGLIYLPEIGISTEAS